MPAISRLRISPTLWRSGFFLSGAGALALWTSILVQEWPRLMAVGTLCGESQSLFGHCLICYPAAGLTVAAIIFDTLWLLDRWSNRNHALA